MKKLFKFKKIVKNKQSQNKFLENETTNGYLVLIGGGEDKRHDRIILKKIVSLNNAQNIAIIPSASRYVKDLGRKYEDVLRI